MIINKKDIITEKEAEKIVISRLIFSRPIKGNEGYKEIIIYFYPYSNKSIFKVSFGDYHKTKTKREFKTLKAAIKYYNKI